MKTSSKRRLFASICLLFPLLLVGLAEGLFRTKGYGGYPPTFRTIGKTAEGTLVITDRAGPASYFPTMSDRMSPIDQYSFFEPKRTNVIRVLVLGESAAKGFPQTMGFAASTFLQAMLEDAHPGKTVEMINLGATAVASFPVLQLAREAAQHDPDVVIVFTGNNEFYGTYGSLATKGLNASESGLTWLRRFHRTGIMSYLALRLRDEEAMEKKRLMELMGQSPIGENDELRAAARTALDRHLRAIVRLFREQNVPVVLCTLPTNERGLAPVGQNDAAKAVFAEGTQLFAAGSYEAARTAFKKALDLDTMPWRITSDLQHVIRTVAAEENAILCDVESAFAGASPGGSIGWELMVDHVHPGMDGQALAGRTMFEAFTNSAMPEALRVSPDTLSQLPDIKGYLAKLGDNPYDRYVTAYYMTALFDIPFLRDSNPDAAAAFKAEVETRRKAMPPAAVLGVKQWEGTSVLDIGRKPIAGLVAGSLLMAGDTTNALPLLAVARRSIPTYTSWYISSTYFWLAAKEKVAGTLSDDDRKEAAHAIEIGETLLAYGQAETGFTDRYIGRLHQILGDFGAAIPYLETARSKLGGQERLANDQALIVSYMKANRKDDALAIASEGASKPGPFQAVYRNFVAQIQSGNLRL